MLRDEGPQADEPMRTPPDDFKLPGKWNHRAAAGSALFGPSDSYIKAMGWLRGFGLIEDWGCGTTRAKTYAGDEPYRGVDGSEGFADVIADLTEYRSNVPCILMRHVLEHNPEWRRVLENAVASFQRRMALVIYTPMAERTFLHCWADRTDFSEPVPEYWFAEQDLEVSFKHLMVARETIGTGPYNVETIYYIAR